MSEWDATSYDAKDNLLHVVGREADNLFTLASAPGAWESPTGCALWQVRDIVGHVIDMTESYFVSFETARSGLAGPAPLGLRVMHTLLDEGAKSHRVLGQDEALQRLKDDFARFMEISAALGPDEWSGFTAPHQYMGPAPAYIFPVFQLVDYGVHSWDIRQGTGRSHALAGDVADLLAPFMFVLWNFTADVPADLPPFQIGIHIGSGHNAGAWRVSVDPSGVTYAPDDTDDLPATIEFDPASLVLTAFGRANAGTVRGDVDLAQRFLNLFFRI